MKYCLGWVVCWCNTDLHGVDSEMQLFGFQYIIANVALIRYFPTFTDVPGRCR